LEAASAQSQIPVTLEWKPFLLNPTMVDEGQNLMDHLVQKYGPSAVANFNDPQSSHLHQMGRAVSIQFNNDRKMVNTLQAHALVEAVKESQGNDVANRLMEHLYQLYFEQAADINDRNVLLAAAAHVAPQMDPLEATRAMEETGRDRILTLDRQVKREWGVSGVTFYVIESHNGSDDPVSFSGAYPIDAIAEYLVKAAAL
jgi:predicted DsbA family dithiol-disulfide isomerase